MFVKVLTRKFIFAFRDTTISSEIYENNANFRENVSICLFIIKSFISHVRTSLDSQDRTGSIAFPGQDT